VVALDRRDECENASSNVEGETLMSWVRLVIVANEVEAETIGGLLETEGIDSVQRFTDVGAGAGDATGSGGPREVLVAPEDLDRAQELLGADATA
jgi:Putative prokaryotic signal transducing protein